MVIWLVWWPASFVGSIIARLGVIRFISAMKYLGFIIDGPGIAILKLSALVLTTACDCPAALSSNSDAARLQLGCTQ